MSVTSSVNCLKFSFILPLLLIFQLGYSQASKKNPKEIGVAQYADLDALFQKQLKPLGNNAVAMLWTDTLVYKRESGEFDARTLAPIGATSKWFTTVLVLKMAEEGKISLDDKVAQYIPIYETYGKSYITIRHCLSHFTGIQAEGKLFSKKKFSSLEDEVASYAKKEIQTNPGTEFRYTDIGHNIAGRILEIVTKKKFDMLIKQKLFNPLGMRKSTFSQLDGSAIDPSDGAQTSAEEMMRFLKMLLMNGTYNGQPFLSEASIKELRSIQATASQVVLPLKTTDGFGYALGSWVVEEGKEKEAAALSGAALTGTYPLIDWCRGYAFLVFTKEENGEQKKEGYLQMKSVIDDQLRSKCQ